MTIHYDQARQFDQGRLPARARRSLTETLHDVGLPIAALVLTVAFLYAVSGLVARVS